MCHLATNDIALLSGYAVRRGGWQPSAPFPVGSMPGPGPVSLDLACCMRAGWLCMQYTTAGGCLTGFLVEVIAGGAWHASAGVWQWHGAASTPYLRAGRMRVRAGLVPVARWSDDPVTAARCNLLHFGSQSAGSQCVSHLAIHLCTQLASVTLSYSAITRLQSTGMQR